MVEEEDMNSPSPVRDLRPLKLGVAGLYPPGHPLRALFEAQPDELPEETLRALLPTVLALGRMKGDSP